MSEGFLTIVDRTVVKEVGDRVEVEWKLSSKPELEWAEIFQMVTTSEREGPVDWVTGGGPDVMNSVIRWFVPVAMIEHAEAESGTACQWLMRGSVRISRRKAFAPVVENDRPSGSVANGGSHFILRCPVVEFPAATAKGGRPSTLRMG